MRIKQYQGLEPAYYRLRVDDYRVVYEVDEAGHLVTILAILPKIAVEIWLLERTKKVESDEEEDNGGSEATASGPD